MATQLDLNRMYTADEFEALSEFGGRCELIDGRLVEKPMPGMEYSWINRLIIRELDRFDPSMKLGVLLPEASTRLGSNNTPQPDLAFWKASRRVNVQLKGAGPRPDLAIEIWSPGDLDTKLNRAEARAKILRYLASGVGLVWAINPTEQKVEVYHSGQLEPTVLGLEDSLSGEDIIPGFILPVRKLFVLEAEQGSRVGENPGLRTAN